MAANPNGVKYPLAQYDKVLRAISEGRRLEVLNGSGRHRAVDHDEALSIVQAGWPSPASFNVLPDMVVIAGCKLPRAEVRAPDYGSHYWSPKLCTKDNNGVTTWVWRNTELDFYRLENGLVHLTITAAQQHGVALRCITKEACNG